jgi:GDP-4-dehydro-6-deoxy-D-mannose reductase
VRVLVTGATGFAGRWLTRELEAAAHEVIAAPPAAVLDIADSVAVERLVGTTRPDVIAHLAAVSFAPDAAADVATALDTNVGGTLAVVEAAIAHQIPLLTTSSSDVYRVRPGEPMPLSEERALGPRGAYGLTKVGAEGIVLAAIRSRGLAALVVRPFNHTGPGQRPMFAVPAFAGRIITAARRGDGFIRAGNVDTARDLGDVRDVVYAYRLLLEVLGGGLPDGTPPVLNIATGWAVSMREVIRRLAEFAGVDLDVIQDPSLTRQDDPSEIVGSSRLLTDLTGWRPRIDLDTTLRDVMDARRAELRAREGGVTGKGASTSGPDNAGA